MFDVPLAQRLTETFEAELPGLEEPWEIGLIVGPSGSGKSTLARRAYGESYYVPPPWPEDKAVIDCLGDLPARDIARLFSAVGLGSPPSWIKPYHVLSNGERFRCDLARAIAGCVSDMCATAGLSSSADSSFDDATVRTEQPVGERPENVVTRGTLLGKPAVTHAKRPLIVFDEFTSVVDRTVAKVASAAIAKLIRRQPQGALLDKPAVAHDSLPPTHPSSFRLHPFATPRFVAVSCHYDIASWLSPDWVLDMATRTLSRRRLRRPELRVEIVRCAREAWTLFARHHYLSGKLSPAARCFLAVWYGQPVAFCATLPAIGRKGKWRVSRLVTLPDYQGIGIGTRVLEAVAELHAAEGHRMTITASHPGLVAHCERSPRWRLNRVVKCGTQRKAGVARYRQFTARSSASFEFVNNDVVGRRS